MSGEIQQQDGSNILQQDGAAILQQDGVAGISWSINPSAGHVTGTIGIAATGAGTSWTGSNPFSVTGGTGAASISGYVNINGQSATFNLVVTALGTIQIADSTNGTVQTYDGAVIPPLACTGLTLSNVGNGAVRLAFTPPADNGGAAILDFTVTLSTGQTATGAASPIDVAAVPGVAVTATVRARNSAGLGTISATSNSVNPSRTVAATFYVDPSGNDLNIGTSALAPWQTVQRVNAFTFIGNDNVLFQAGQHFTGPLLLPSSGTAGNPIYFGTRARPSDLDDVGTYIAQTNPAYIDAGTGNGIKVVDKAHYILDNLIVSGAGVSAVDGTTTSTAAGISLKSTQAATKLAGVRIIACTATGCKDGIVAWTDDDPALFGWDDLRIWGCDAHDNQRIGFIIYDYDIDNDTTSQAFPGGAKTQNSNLYIGHCQAYNQYGSALVAGAGGFDVRCITGALVEYCLAKNVNPYGAPDAVGGSSGFGCAQCDGVIRQYCEVLDVRAPNNVDGVGFDTDIGATNGIDRFCYAHGCDGAGWFLGGTVAKPCTGHLIHDCVSANNVQVVATTCDEIFTFSTAGVGLTIYNTTVYAPNSDAIGITDTAALIKVYNSILAHKVGSKSVDGDLNAAEGNLYWPIGGSAANTDIDGSISLAAWRVRGFESQGGNNGVVADPLLSSPTSGVHTATLPGANVSTIAYFNIPTGSPAKDVGEDLTVAPYSLASTPDFHGRSRPVGAGYDIGSVEYVDPVTGTLSSVDANDSLAASGISNVFGTISADEINDTLAAAGNVVTAGTISGAIAATEISDTLDASGMIAVDGTISGSIDATEQNDTFDCNCTIPSLPVNPRYIVLAPQGVRRKKLPRKDPEAQVIVGFNFAGELAGGETISAPVVTAIWAGGAADDEPDETLVGLPQVESPWVTQLVDDGIAGVNYRLQCVVQTSLDQVLVLSATLPVREA